MCFCLAHLDPLSVSNVQDKYEQQLDALRAEVAEASDAVQRAVRDKERAEDKLAAALRDHAGEMGSLESQLRSTQDVVEQLSVSGATR